MPVKVRVKKIAHVGVSVRDLDRTVEFYEKHLGMRLTERFEYPPEDVGHGAAVTAGAFVRCDSTHHCFSFFSLKDNDPNEPIDTTPHLGLHHIAFEMGSPQDLIDKYKEFRDANIPIVDQRFGGPGNHPRFYARDPDGNLLEFYWGIDDIGWDGEPREGPPIVQVELESFDFEEQDRARDAGDPAPLPAHTVQRMS